MGLGAIKGVFLVHRSQRNRFSTILIRLSTSQKALESRQGYKNCQIACFVYYCAGVTDFAMENVEGMAESKNMKFIYTGGPFAHNETGCEQRSQIKFFPMRIPEIHQSGK